MAPPDQQRESSGNVSVMSVSVGPWTCSCHSGAQGSHWSTAARTRATKAAARAAAILSVRSQPNAKGMVTPTTIPLNKLSRSAWSLKLIIGHGEQCLPVTQAESPAHSDRPHTRSQPLKSATRWLICVSNFTRGVSNFTGGRVTVGRSKQETRKTEHPITDEPPNPDRPGSRTLAATSPEKAIDPSSPERAVEAGAATPVCSLH
jgi:hypothetical protein